MDPLSATPIVVTGSANFSEASTHTNNEDMVVIRNDTRAADIDLGEFMRLYTHYAFREAVALWHANHPDTAWAPHNLALDDGWQQDDFTDGTARCLRRRYFAGV